MIFVLLLLLSAGGDENGLSLDSVDGVVGDVTELATELRLVSVGYKKAEEGRKLAC